MSRGHGLLVALTLALPANASAATFENSYLTFEMPQDWSCEREETEFVCQPDRIAGRPADAIMILTAKLIGPDDTLASYLRRFAPNSPDAACSSPIQPARLATINATTWVDATCLGSEIPNYVTRYVATARDGIAVLFTFSAHRTRHDALLGAAMQAVYTLRVKKDWRTQKTK